MNKYQEALEEAKLEYAIFTDEGSKAKQKAFATLQELVDRATPKKVLNREEEALCPNCHNMGQGEYGEKYPFCPHCGQALEWEEGEKK